MRKWVLVISILLISSSIFSGAAIASSSYILSTVSVYSGGVIQYEQNPSVMTQVKVVGNTFSFPLRGVNCEGMEYWPYTDDLREKFTPSFYARIKSLGFTCVRHPYAIDLYNYDTFYPGQEDLGIAYRELMTDITEWCLENELYIIWDFHRWRWTVGDDWEVQDPQIYEDTMRNIAIQLGGYPNFILEMGNEPMSSNFYTYVRNNIPVIRNTGYTGLIIVPISPGVAPLLNNPIYDPLNNLAYDYHVYWYYRQWKPTPWTDNSVDGIYEMLEREDITVLAEDYPLLIGEFGAYNEWNDEIEFMINMATLCEREGWAWTNWTYELDSVTVWAILSDWNTLNTSGEALVNYLNSLEGG